ncbi:hypothetical protein ZWY2020_046221 [Hordeum vulgare]|nr:hypothetical protein ZWY2020_046221 [Hordeum vulgare]
MSYRLRVSSVPLVFASFGGWSNNKNDILSCISLWIGLVFLVHVLSSLFRKY